MRRFFVTTPIVYAAMIALPLLSLASMGHALTLKSGEVIGSDGSVYQGASPEQAANIAKNANETDWFGNKKTSGVVGKNIYLVVDDQTIFIPLSEIQGKKQDQIEAVITNYVVEALTQNLGEIHLDELGKTDFEAVARDSAGLVDDEVVNQLARDAAETALADPEAAKALVEATINLAKQTASDPAVEAAYEAANEAAHQAKCAGKEGTGNGC